MNAATLAELRRQIRLGIDRDHEPDTDRIPDDEGAVSWPALWVAAAAIFAAWFVYTRPVVALALFVGGLCVVGFVTVAAGLFWVLFVWGSDRAPGEVDGAADPIDADRADLPYGGGWGA